MPQRIQLSRRKGWKMPSNTVKVARPSSWGNPFRIMPKLGPVRTGALYVSTAQEAVDYFRDYMTEQMREHKCVRDAIAELRGKNLACWCQPGEPCHADVLLELANAKLSGGDSRPLELLVGQHSEEATK